MTFFWAVDDLTWLSFLLSVTCDQMDDISATSNAGVTWDTF